MFDDGVGRFLLCELAILSYHKFQQEHAFARSTRLCLMELHIMLTTTIFYIMTHQLTWLTCLASLSSSNAPHNLEMIIVDQLFTISLVGRIDI